MPTHQVESRGIYHGLPVLPSKLKKQTAIITGANGISGQHMLRVLAQSPDRWSKIYCLSRRMPAIPTSLPSQAEHIPLDFLQDPSAIATALRSHGIRHVDYVFFYSYIQVAPRAGHGLWSNAEDMSIVNTELLSNFLSALTLAGIKPRRVLLQTGAKQYGVHLGPAPVPQEEHDPRVLIEPNFYYSQEDYLFEWCADNGVGWNVVRPSFILGAVPDAAMNLCFPLAVYAAVCKRLGAPLEFRADLEAWETPQEQSSAMLNGYMAEWAVLTEETDGEAFNAADGSVFTWGKFWPKLAACYGVEYRTPDLDESKYTVVKIPREKTPRGFGPQATIRRRFSLTQWAEEPEVKQAWRELAQEHDLIDKELRDVDRIFAFTDGALANAVRVNFSMDKARRYGFFGTVSSTESMLEVLQDFAKLKMAPPINTGKFG